MSAHHQKIAALVFAAFLPFTAIAQLDRLLAPLSKNTVLPEEISPNSVANRTQAPSYTLGAESFAAEVEKELSARLALNGELKLTLAQPWKPLKMPAADFAVALIEIPTTGIAGTFVVRAKITSGGDTVSEVQISLRAQLWQEVWTAASRLERGQTLDRSLLTVSKVDTLRERQPPLLAEVDPANLEVAQTVAASRPITRRDVIERPLVRRGQVVEVIARQGQLAITMKALALESGASGSLIKLRNLESRKEFSGQILNENKVQVHF